ncbi:MAG: hypothetical protein H0V35_15490 [Nitrospira sp.]|nr:hypothetical protein [Nitrospira sp.]
MSKKKDKKHGPRAAVALAMMKRDDKQRWAPFLEYLGLDEESCDRLTRLLVLHLVLDRTLTGMVALRFLGGTSSFSKIEETVATLPVSKRIDLLKTAHIISDSCAQNLKAVNSARNNLAHYQPKLGYGLDNVKEISSEEAFTRLLHKGLPALYEVTKSLDKACEEIIGGATTLSAPTLEEGE